VTAEGTGFPALDGLSLDVSEASLKPDIRLRWPGGRRQAGLSARSVRFVGQRVRYEQAALDFELVGQGVHFDINEDGAEHFLDPIDAEHGQFHAHISTSDLATLLLHSAQQEVQQHGLQVEGVEVKLQEGDGRTVSAQVRVTASTTMAFATIRAVVLGNGQIAIDEHFNVAFRNLTFDGEGLAGKMAAGVARTYLQEWDGWSFPMATLVLGKLRIRDIKLTCRDGLQVAALVAGQK
jgi:hypothetical protein